MFLENLSVEEIKINALHLMINDLHINGYFGGILHPTRREMGNIFSTGYSRQGIFYPPPFNKLVMFYFMRSEKNEHGVFQKQYVFQDYQKRYLDFWQRIGVHRVNFIVLPFFENRRDLVRTSRGDFFNNFFFIDALDIPIGTTQISIDNFNHLFPILNAKFPGGREPIGFYYSWPLLLYLSNLCDVGVRFPSTLPWRNNLDIFNQNRHKFSFWGDRFNSNYFEEQYLKFREYKELSSENDDWESISENIQYIDEKSIEYYKDGTKKKRSNILRNTSFLSISSEIN